MTPKDSSQADLLEEAKQIYPDGWKEPKPYIHIVPRPGQAHPVAA